MWEDIPAPPAAPTAEPAAPMFTESPAEAERREAIATADVEPMLARHSESPFEEPVAGLGYSADAFELEQPPGMHIEPAPLAAEVPAPVDDRDSAFGGMVTPRDEPAAMTADTEADEVFAPSEEPSFPSYVPPPPPDADDFAKTITMADLYAQQGLIDEARDIYEDILMRDPSNNSVRAKLEALSDQPPPAGFDEAPADEEPAAFGGVSAAPFEAPIETHAEAPFEASIETPFGSSEPLPEPPIETPFSSSAETPFESHSETPFQSHSETPFQPQSETPFESAHETPFESAHETPFETSFPPLAEAPPLEPAEEPVHAAAETHAPFDLPVETPPPAPAPQQSGGRNAKVTRLQSWLTKVSR